MSAKKPKQVMSARVSGVVRELIRAERGKGESDGEFIERLVLEHVTTERGRRIVETHAEHDPLARAAIETMRQR